MSTLYHPFGARGAYPASIEVGPDHEQFRELQSIPGIRAARQYLYGTWDAIETVHRRLGLVAPQAPAPLTTSLASSELTAEVAQFPGLPEYNRLGLRNKMRLYQREGAAFLARRAYAMECDPPRLGKTFQALAASVLINSSKTLIICPALVSFVWAEEIWKWLGQEAIVLEGRRGIAARQFCGTCGGVGYTQEHKHCPACKYLNGQSRGSRILRVGDTRRDLTEALYNHKYVIVSYELLQGQRAVDSTGAKYVRDDLVGWRPTLAAYHFEAAIIDEIHQIRGWKPNSDGHSRRECVVHTTDPINVVWGLTGTPLFSYTRDLWAQWDLISKGAITGPGRLPFKFHAYACDGHKDEYGWKADGRSQYAETELPDRMRWFTIQRERSAVLTQMPVKTRQVIRVDADPATTGAVKRLVNGKTGKRESKLVAALGQTGVTKRPIVIDSVLNEILQGGKVIIFTYLERSAVAMHRDLTKALSGKVWGPPLRARNTELWLVTGDRVSAANRPAVAREFRDHPGAAIMVATIASMQVGVSLRGAQSVHFAELSWDPSALIQAEDRPYEPGTSGINVIYYVVRNSIDEHIEALVLPKFQSLEKVVGDTSAIDVRSAFAGPKETMEEIFARLCDSQDDSDDEISDLDIADIDI